MKHMKKIILFVLGLVAGTTVYAQEVETTVAADVVSQYIWRGQDLGNVSLQPTLGVEYKGLSLSAWGSVGLSQPALEELVSYRILLFAVHDNIGYQLCVQQFGDSFLCRAR